MKNHPNRMPFRGVLTILDTPSDRPPAGARGHRVVLTRAAAEAALPSLIKLDDVKVVCTAHGGCAPEAGTRRMLDEIVKKAQS